MSGSKKNKMKKRLRFRLPHVYTIAFLLIVFFAALTWVVPSGQFDRKMISTAAGEREVAVAGTYHEVDKLETDASSGETVDYRQGVPAILQAPTKGIQAAADVVAFVLLIGGSFAVIAKTNALNAGMSRVVKKLKNRDVLIVPIMMTLFSICGTTFGMSEEALPFYAVFIPVMMGLGYDSMTAFIICFLAPNIGYAASTIDPFNVLISQGIIGIEGNPQLWLRFIAWLVMTGAGIAWAMRYAHRVKAAPATSITYEDDKDKRVEFAVSDSSIEQEFTLRQKLVVIEFVMGMGVIVWGLVTQGWYMDQISMVFTGMGLFAGVLGGLDQETIADEFVKGISDFAYAACIIGIARGILVVAESGLIIDTILNSLAGVLSGAPAAVYTTFMYIVLGLLSFLVPSSSGLAALTMPVMGPLTELVGLNPESAVTALQFANQTINTISPVAGMTVAGLAVCRISFAQWWKTIWKFFLFMVATGIVLTAVSGVLPN
ncbi:C4-dicarboxylate anaerobic carrier [Coriobacterium glomerans PW2]|uniref:C4-dicarboxylate anaerobic carrier n=2 Tax=Coriobacterium TaxID=33870 RepID=F2N7K1_CORGP|nr:C4-dicarboxylate anaerobic carrier [Coriobacterium glomerans PW2]